MIPVYSENNTKPINALCEQKQICWIVKQLVHMVTLCFRVKLLHKCGTQNDFGSTDMHFKEMPLSFIIVCIHMFLVRTVLCFSSDARESSTDRLLCLARAFTKLSAGIKELGCCVRERSVRSPRVVSNHTASETCCHLRIHKTSVFSWMCLYPTAGNVLSKHCTFFCCLSDLVVIPLCVYIQACAFTFLSDIR
jgi:hypothetical protein